MEFVRFVDYLLHIVDIIYKYSKYKNHLLKSNRKTSLRNDSVVKLILEKMREILFEFDICIAHNIHNPELQRNICQTKYLYLYIYIFIYLLEKFIEIGQFRFYK